MPPMSQSLTNPPWPSSLPHIVLQARRRFRHLARWMLPCIAGESFLEEKGPYLAGILAQIKHAVEQSQTNGPRDLYRAAGKQVRSLLNYLAASLELRLATKETREWAELHSLVGSLPEQDQELFDLILYAGLGEAQVAGLLGVPAGTVGENWEHAQGQWRNMIRALLSPVFRPNGPDSLPGPHRPRTPP